MNVMLLSDWIVGSGVGTYVRTLAEGLEERGHQVVIVSGGVELDVDRFCCYNLELATKNPIRILKNVFRIRKIVKQHSIDVAHVNHRMSGFHMRVYNWFFRLPTVWTVHTSRMPNGFLVSKMTYPGTKTIAISSEVKEFCERDLKISPENIELVFNGVDQEVPFCEEEVRVLKQKYGVDDSKLVMCALGRIDEVKGLDTLIDLALATPPQKRKNFLFLISGKKEGSYYSELTQRIQSNALSQNFIFTGWVPSRELLAVSDLMLLCSGQEGFALVVAEAFMYGVPVIRTRTGGYEDCKEYCTGFDYGDTQTLISLIDSFLTDRGAFQEKSERAKRFADRELTSGRMVEKTIAVYEKII